MYSYSAAIFCFLALAGNCAHAASSGPDKPKEYIAVHGQADAFIMEKEIISAYGHYFETHIAVKDKTKAADNVIACTNNNANCDKELLLESLMQYNVGKEINRLVVESQTNAEKLQSAPGFNPAVQNLGKNAPHQNFKFDTEDPNFGKNLFETDPDAVRKGILGEKFMQQYRSFIDANTKVNRENFAKMKPSADGKDYVYDQAKGKNIIDEAEYNSVSKSVNSPKVQEAIKEFKETLPKSPKIIVDPSGKNATLDASGLKLDKTGLNAVAITPEEEKAKGNSDAEFYKATAKQINVEIDSLVDKNKKNLLTKDPNIIADVSYNIDLKEFNCFLNEIWPPAAEGNPGCPQPPPPSKP